MQRLPARTTTVQSNGPVVSRERTTVSNVGDSTQHARLSPLKQLANRIRDEQGAEQIKAFLLAMRPFAAPNELKKLGAEFGMDFDGISAAFEAERLAERRRLGGSNDKQQNAQAQQNSNGMQSQLQMLQKLMYLQSVLNGGGDPSALFGGMGKTR